MIIADRSEGVLLDARNGHCPDPPNSLVSGQHIRILLVMLRPAILDMLSGTLGPEALQVAGWLADPYHEDYSIYVYLCRGP